MRRAVAGSRARSGPATSVRLGFTAIDSPGLIRGARGVGMATTQAVVYSSVSILGLDYLLTVMMF